MFPTRSVEFYQALFDEDLYPYMQVHIVGPQWIKRHWSKTPYVTNVHCEELRHYSMNWPMVCMETNRFSWLLDFRKPHEPLIFPEEFLEHYPKEDIRLGAFRRLPKNFPLVSWNERYIFIMSRRDVNNFWRILEDNFIFL